MPNHRSLEIYKALKKTDRKAALEYLELANYREWINKQAELIRLGMPIIRLDIDN